MSFSPGSVRLPGAQRGAAAVLASIMLVAMLAAAGFAIDMAQLYSAKRELQKQANLSALNAARGAGGCLAPDDPRGRYNVAFSTVQTTLAQLNPQGATNPDMQVRLGRVDAAPGGLRAFAALPSSRAGEAYAVDVSLSRPAPRLVLPLPGISSDERPMLQARAVAAMAPSASFRVGGSLLSVNQGYVSLLNAVLGALLGGDPQLEVLGVNGLLATTVRLEELAVALGMHSVDQMLYSTLSLLDVLTGVLAVAVQSGSDGAAQALSQIANVAPDQPVVVGDSLSAGAALVSGVGNTVVNALDLVSSLLFQLGGSEITLGLPVNIPGIASAELALELAGLPVLGVGPALADESGYALTFAQSSQAQVDLSLNLLPLLGSPLAVNLQLDVVQSQAELLDVDCAGPQRSQPSVRLGLDAGLAALKIQNDGIRHPPLVNLLGLIQICAWTEQPPPGGLTYEERTLTGPFDPDDPELLARNTIEFGAGAGTQLSQLLSDVLDNTYVQFCPGSPLGPALNLILLPILSLLGLGSANGLLDLVEGLLTGVLSGILDPVLDPLLAMLGVSISGGEVTVLDVYMAPPALIEVN